MKPQTRPALSLLLAALVVGSSLLAMVPAVASGEAPPLGVRAALGGEAQSAGAGLYRVQVGGGESLLTHGPDPAPVRTPSRSLRGAPERPPMCASDHYQHVLVGRLSGTPDRSAQAADSVRAIFGRINAMLNRDALESGGVSADFKVLCDSGGALRIDSFESPTAEFGDIVRSARAAGFGAPNADYTVFFDAPSLGEFCGVASFISDERLVAGNASNTGGGYAVTYHPCWQGDAPMHEIGHTQGAVQYSAPHSTGSGGHCNQLFDVICYAPDGGDRNQAPPTLDCPGDARFDCGYDDYFDAGPEPGEYLASHWNLGSPLNRFIAFRPAGQDPEPSPAPPPCDRAECATRLRLGVPARGVGDSSSGALFRLRVPARTAALRLSVTTPRPVEIWLRRGGVPGPASVCRAKRRASVATCRVARPRAGKWFLSLGGDTATEFELLATAARGGSR